MGTHRVDCLHVSAEDVHSHGVTALEPDLVPTRQEVVEAGYEVRVASEEAGDPGYQSRHVDGLLVERLHDAQEVFVHVRLVVELGLYLVQVCESILNLSSLELNLHLFSKYPFNC